MISPNPYSWTAKASLVFLEQPAGVGFSYSTDSSLQYSWNDFRAATDNLLTLKAFFHKFPEQSKTASGFFIASESYGGHYMPQLALQILNDADLSKRFRGLLVGNPFTSYASGSIAMANAAWGLQMVPKPLWSVSLLVYLSIDSFFSTYDDYLFGLWYTGIPLKASRAVPCPATRIITLMNVSKIWTK